MPLEQAPRLGEGVVLCEGRLVDEELDRSFKLNATMEEIVASLDGELGPDDITERHATAHAIDRSTARRDVEAVLTSLKRSKLLAGPRRTRVVTINKVQKGIINHHLVLPIMAGIMKLFDWYFRIILKVLGGTTP